MSGIYMKKMLVLFHKRVAIRPGDMSTIWTAPVLTC